MSSLKEFALDGFSLENFVDDVDLSRFVYVTYHSTSPVDIVSSIGFRYARHAYCEVFANGEAGNVSGRNLLQTNGEGCERGLEDFSDAPR